VKQAPALSNGAPRCARVFCIVGFHRIEHLKSFEGQAVAFGERRRVLFHLENEPHDFAPLLA
jgi:hypothetical protein